ncbi:MAG: CpsD/CapB family tyrosine-protein kinase [Bacilli bacterium]|nr:CpsD/CapB family tyrosine-protein kinase [Bacilli bacterium]
MAKLVKKVFGKKTHVNRSESIFYDKGINNVKESIDRLKDNVLYYAIDGSKKVIQFESSISGEAKTTTTVNLAVALGESNKKVVVIDLDFRKPRVHRAFRLDNENGISDYLIDKIDKKALLKETDYKNVYVITRGSEVQNPTSILTSEKMANLIEELKQEFDFVLLDCPPVLMISDYIHISRLSDGVIFNMAYGKTKKAQVKEAISLLRKNNIPIIGSVFTFYDPKKANSYGDYQYYNYYYNYEDHCKQNK